MWWSRVFENPGTFGIFLSFNIAYWGPLVFKYYSRRFTAQIDWYLSAAEAFCCIQSFSRCFLAFSSGSETSQTVKSGSSAVRDAATTRFHFKKKVEQVTLHFDPLLARLAVSLHNGLYQTFNSCEWT